MHCFKKITVFKCIVARISPWLSYFAMDLTVIVTYFYLRGSVYLSGSTVAEYRVELIYLVAEYNILISTLLSICVAFPSVVLMSSCILPCIFM